MSVLIKGMEIPKRCGECPCFHAENPMYCQAVKADKNKKIIAPYGKPRPEWCPLVPIPPHGRLIDADALENEAQMRLLECNKYDNQFQKPYEVMRAIALAPAVIESEGE